MELILTQHLTYNTKWNISLLPTYLSTDVPDYLIFPTLQVVTNPTPIYG